MEYVVLGAWVIQAAVGVWLFVRWIFGGGGRAGTVVTHVVGAVASLVAWIVFVVTGGLAWAWAAFAVVTVANAVGDTMLRGRERRRAGSTGFWRDYGAAIASVFRGRMPPAVAFHAAFAGVVYFTCLGVAIGATIAA